MNIHKAKTQLSRLLERVAGGERVVISKAGKPVADLVSHQAVDVAFGGLRGQLTYDDSCFDIDPEIQEKFNGRDDGVLGDRLENGLGEQPVRDPQ